jgi:aminoglycoside 3-N-acetyltransferase
MNRKFVKKILPEKVLAYVNYVRQKQKIAKIYSRPVITEARFRDLLRNELWVDNGDIVLVHSSVDQLHLDFPIYRILSLIQEVIGGSGTLLFPTYPRQLSYEYLRGGEVFDIQKSASYTGVLTEIARRQKHALRSLHPTKSVCALGKYAAELTDSQQASPFPYDYCSPYRKIVAYHGKVIGLGVSTATLSFVHCVDDALKGNFPVEPYHRELFHAQCIDYHGRRVLVDTFAHNMKKIKHNIPRYMEQYIRKDICKDVTLQGAKFFAARTNELFESMTELAKDGVTIYARDVYSKRAKQ